VIYFDEERSQPVRDELEIMASAHPNIAVRFVENSNHVLPDLRELSSSRTDDMIITTRLDNDDVLHPRFLEDVQNASLLQNAPKCIIDFPNYYALRLETGKMFRKQMLITTPFSSLVETGNKISTVLSVQHQELGPEFGLVRQLAQRRTMVLWHGSNVLNGRSSKTLKVTVNRLLGRRKEKALSKVDTEEIKKSFGLNSTEFAFI
jgi:hypothetical protein